MLNKRFLKESPVIWSYIGIVIALTFLVLSLLQIDWIQAGILLVLLVWMACCARKDYTIWILTKKD